MAKVAVVTDSSACLPAALIKEFEITVVPLGLLIDGQLYEDGSLTAHQFYTLLRQARQIPTTTSPPPGVFLDTFRRLARENQAILCITLSAKFSSGTINAAREAARQASLEISGVSVRVVDSRGLAMAHGFAVLTAAQVAARTGDPEAAAEAAQAVGQQALLIGVLDTLRYLAKGGRVPWIAHWAASLLQIKPILMAQQEEVKAVERARTWRRALERLLYHARRYAEGRRDLMVAVMHADAQAAAQSFAQRVAQELQPTKLLVTEFTPVMGVHTGPGFMGLTIYGTRPASQASVGSPAQEAAAEEGDTALPEDVSRIEASLEPLPLPQPRPALVVVSGLPGSGKSHFTRQLCQRFPLARLESDALRKALFGKPTYSPEESARLFAACHQVLDRLLARGIPAVLDATNLREIHRRPLYRIAEKNRAKLILVNLEAPAALVHKRLADRRRGLNPWDHSDAGPEVYQRMREQAEPLPQPHIRVDTSRDIEPALEAVLRQLQGA